MDVTAFIRRIATPLLDFVYPPVCSLCDQELVPGERAVCAQCWGTFTPVDPDHPVWQELLGKLISGGVVDGLIACYLFEKEGKLQEALHLLKYSGWKGVGVHFGNDIGRRLLAESSSVGAVDCLVPVPLHRVKQRERGYNQSMLLCTGISEVTGLPVLAKALRRTRYTHSQTTLNADERKRNVGGAFALDPRCRQAFEGKHCLIVDDVLTTGATINACAAVLKDGGASRVTVASVALAQ